MERREQDDHQTDKSGGSKGGSSSSKVDKKKTIEGRSIGKESPSSAPTNPSSRKGKMSRPLVFVGRVDFSRINMHSSLTSYVATYRQQTNFYYTNLY